MGFLMGAYGKLMAGKYLRNLQFEQMQIQSQLHRVTKQFQTMQKMFDSQKRTIQNQMQAQYSNYMQQFMLGSGMGDSFYGYMNGQLNNGGMDQNAYQQYNAKQMQMQMQYAQAKTYYENMFEMQQESMLQPIKDLEEDLQTRLDSLKSQILIAENEYKAYQEEEKAGAQSIKPDMTGQS